MIETNPPQSPGDSGPHDVVGTEPTETSAPVAAKDGLSDDQLFLPPDEAQAGPGLVDEVEPDAAAELASLQERFADVQDKYLRKAAELENTKRRLQKQMDEVKRYGIAEVVQELLPVLDDLERAIEHASKSEEGQVRPDDSRSGVDSFVDGMSLVTRKFVASLEKFGVRRFETVGQPFDPELHEAISQVETTEHPEGTVVSEFLKGYLLNDRLVRPALVFVARSPAPSRDE